MLMPPTLDVQQTIDAAPLSVLQRKAIAMTMVIVFFDGVDALIMAITAPSIAKEWGITTASMTPAIIASLLGMILGGILLAPRADRYGRRPVLIAGVVIFAALTLVASAAQSLEQLAALRFFAGIGLGAVVSNGFAYGAEFAPQRMRATVVTMIGASAAAGAFICGLLASAIIPSMGWRFVFILGGALPLLLVPALLRWLPETVQFLTIKGRQQAALSLLRSIDVRTVDSSSGVLSIESFSKGEKPSIKLLFAARFAPITLLFCVIYFAAVLLMYFLLSWIPSVLTDAGFSTGQAVFASSVCNLGAMIGGITLGTRIDRSKSPYRILSFAFLVAAIAIVVTAFSLGSLVVLMTSLLFVGAFSTGTQMGVNAVTTDIYPAWLRATGVGFLTSVGRFGSVVGPSIGGALLAAQLPAKTIFLLAVIPAIVAASGMAALGVVVTSRRRGQVLQEQAEACTEDRVALSLDKEL